MCCLSCDPSPLRRLQLTGNCQAGSCQSADCRLPSAECRILADCLQVSADLWSDIAVPASFGLVKGQMRVVVKLPPAEESLREDLPPVVKPWEIRGVDQLDSMSIMDKVWQRAWAPPT